MVGAISGVSSYYNISGVFQRTSQATGAQSGENSRAVQGGGTASPVS